MKCFYHTDFDGECAAAIVYGYYKDNFDKEIECIPINYNKDFPFNTIGQNELIVIVDFSLQKPGEFEKLLTITKDVIWIDHHGTAIEKHRDLDNKYKIPGIRSTEKSGCELTWEYYHPNRKTPLSVKLLGDYDTWTFDYGDRTRFFQEGLKLEDTNPKSNVWRGLFIDKYYTKYIIKDGKTAIQYRDKCNEKLINNWSYWTEFEGYKAIVCNVGNASSNVFNSVKEDYDIMLACVYDGKLWSVSIYTKRKDIDVSEIAVKYKGGGHPQASGFNVTKLPFKRIN